MKPILFYDGTCGLCHGVVKWAVKHDPSGVFRYAALGGATFQQLLGAESAELPDSVMALDEDGRLYLRSDAVIFVLQRLGWTGAAGTLAIVPPFLRDAMYSFIARIRFALMGKKADSCPLLPAELRSRFLE